MVDVLGLTNVKVEQTRAHLVNDKYDFIVIISMLFVFLGHQLSPRDVAFRKDPVGTPIALNISEFLPWPGGSGIKSRSFLASVKNTGFDIDTIAKSRRVISCPCCI